MKKRIFSVLLLSTFLVGIFCNMAAAATITLTIKETNSSGNIVASGQSITLDSGTKTYYCTTSGGSGTSYAWSVTEGTSIAKFGSSTTATTANPTLTISAPGEGETVTVKISGNRGSNTAGTWSITVSGPAPQTVTVEDAPKPEFKTKSITGLKAGTPLGDGKEIELTKDESVLGTVTWAITDADVEKLASYGLAFDVDSHTLTGTPTASGTFSFTVTASNVNGDTPQSTSQAISVTISGTKPTFLSWMPADKANMGKITAATTDMIGPFFKNGVLVMGRAIAPYPAEETTGGETNPENPDDPNASLPRRNGDGEDTETTESDTQQFILAVQGTLPITVSVTGLPAGLTATQPSKGAGKTAIDAGADQTVAPDGEEATYNGGNGTAWVVITGTPTKAGVNKSVKITAKNADGEISRTYTMEVLATPTLKTTSVKATWGKELKTTLKADGGTKDHPITWAIASGDLPYGIELDEKTGELKGTYKLNDGGDVFGEGEKTHTFSVWIMPENDAGTAEDPEALTSKTKVDIVMSLAKPVIENKKAKVTYGDKTAIALSSLPKMKLEDGAITPIFLVVSGGGALTWTSGDLPAGLSVAMAKGYTPDDTGALPRRNGAEGDDTTGGDNTGIEEVDRSIVIYGTPTDTAKNQSVKFQVANAAGNDSVTLKFNIEATELQFPVTGEGGGVAELPGATFGDYTTDTDGYAVGAEVSVHLVAKPGPVTFSAKNLPAGITLSADKKGGTEAWLVGTYSKATKFDKKGQNIVTITATNKNITDKKKGVKMLSADWRVFEAPEITTTKFSDLTTGKKYTGKVAVKNAGKNNIAVRIHETEPLEANWTGMGEDEVFDLDGKSNYKLSWSADIMAIVGSLDRMPDGGQLYVSIKAKNAAGEAETVTLPLKVKGQAPKLTTSKLNAFKAGEASIEATAQTVEASGTQPITLRAYIDNKTAKAFGWLPSDAESTASIDITNIAAQIDDVTANPTGFVFVPTAASPTTDDQTPEEGGARPRNNGEDATGEPTGKGKLYFLGQHRDALGEKGNARASYKGLPITFVAYNAASTKPTTKAIKVDVNGGLDPVIMFTPQEVATTDETTGEVTYTVGDMIVMSKDVTVYATKGELAPMTFQVSGDTPVTISAKGDKNGVTSTVTDATTITIQGAEIPTTKETKTVITITALNPSTKKKAAHKLTVIQPLAPTITTAEKGLTKEVELGKKFSLKVAAKGSKTIKWSIVAPADGAENTKADLIALGLSLDQKGAITGTPVGTTSVDVDGVPTYKPMTFTVKAENAGGSDTKVVTVGVKGKKPKLLTKTLTISKDEPAFDVDSARILTNIETTDTKSFVTFSFESESGVNGLTFATPNADERNIGRLTGTPEAATKGTSAKIKIENLGTEVKGSLKLIIRDPAPEIEGNADLSVSASATEKASAETTLTVAEPSDGAKIAWKITKKPTAKGVTLKLKGDGASATLTVTVPKKFAQTVSDTFTISATNGSSKLSGTIDGTISVTPAPEETDESALPDDESATPEGEETAETETETEAEETAETETESEETAAEGEITLGTARTEAQLTDGQRAMLEKGGYVIAAILPEITVTADGQYDIDNIELNENAPEGAELVWFAFPSEATTDDDIVDFYDEAGAEIKGVPASRKIVASPWLNEGVTYTPVIAVKAKNAGGARDTLEGAEEGSVVTQEALETAAAPAE